MKSYRKLSSGPRSHVLCQALALGGLLATPAFAGEINLAQGGSGTYSSKGWDQIYRVDVTVVGNQPLRAKALILNTFVPVGIQSSQVFAEIQSQAGDPMASLSSSVAQAGPLRLPLSGNLRQGQSYSLLLSVSQGTSEFFDADPAGPLLDPYVESKGMLRIEGVYKSRRSTGPWNATSKFPNITLEAVARKSVPGHGSFLPIVGSLFSAQSRRAQEPHNQTNPPVLPGDVIRKLFKVKKNQSAVP